MLVSHRKKFIFLKTVKTAGTSLEMALEPWARPEGSEGPIEHVTSMCETEAGIVGARGRGAGHQKFFNHISAAKLKSLLPENVWSEYTKITSIRNPWDKVVSLFHMLRPGVKDREDNEIIASYARKLVTA